MGEKLVDDAADILEGSFVELMTAVGMGPGQILDITNPMLGVLAGSSDDRRSLMTWSLLLATHAFAASVALPLGAWQLFRPTKGDHQHRLIGRTWVVLMLYVSFTSFWIKELDPASSASSTSCRSSRSSP